MREREKERGEQIEGWNDTIRARARASERASERERESTEVGDGCLESSHTSRCSGAMPGGAGAGRDGVLAFESRSMDFGEKAVGVADSSAGCSSFAQFDTSSRIVSTSAARDNVTW